MFRWQGFVAQVNGFSGVSFFMLGSFVMELSFFFRITSAQMSGRSEVF